MLRGAIPNHTFESVYGASNLWIIAAAFKVTGYSVTVERSVGIAYRLVVLSSLAVLAWRRRGPVAALAAGTICIVLVEGRAGLQAYAWMCALAFAALGFLLLDLGLARGLRKGPVAVAGLCLGLAVCARLDMVLAVALVLVALFLACRGCLPWLIAGLAAGALVLVATALRSGVTAVVRDQIIQPIFVSGPARRLPLSKLSWQELTLLFFCVAVAAASVVVGAVRVRRTINAKDPVRSWDPVVLLTIGAFELGILPEAFQRNDQLHLALVACFILPAAVLLPARPTGIDGSWAWTSWAAPMALGLLVLAMAEPYFGSAYWSASQPEVHERAEHIVSNDGRSVPVDSGKDERNLMALLKEIDARSHAGQRVFVGPRNLRTANYNDTYIYFLLPQLIPGSYYLEMNPGVANAKGSQLTRDLGQDQFLLLTGRYDKWPDPDRSTRFGPDAPNKAVKSEFRRIGVRGPWILYQRRS
jgi:hypothetical protein